MTRVIQIDGGLGRVIAASPAIERAAQSDKVIVVTPWIDAFAKASFIERLYPPDFPYLFDDVIKGNRLTVPEPYHLSAYYNDNMHIIDAFDMLINGDVQVERKPKIFLAKQEQKAGAQSIVDLKKQLGEDKPVICLQAFGATFKAEHDADATNRSLNMKQALRIIEQIDAIFINFSTVPITHKRVFNKELHVRNHIAMAAYADYCIGVDSVLTHVAAAFDRVGTFFYGSTDPKQLGYERFQNIQRAGYPKGHQTFRLPCNPNISDGAMDFTDDELDAAIDAIKTHLEKCRVPQKKEKTPSKVVDAEVVPEKECKSA